jgi:hypothetical protein
MKITSIRRIRFAVAAASLAMLAGVASPARAMPSSFTDAAFVTVAAGSTLQFTFDGFAAADTDILRLNGQLIFDNQTATIGQTVTTAPLAAGTYQLSLTNNNTGVTYFSDPALNPDGAHLAFSNTFTDFNLGPLPPGGGAPTYYGWEDLPLGSGPTLDYNDLVFSLQVIPPSSVAEPGTLMLIGGSLIGLTALRRRRRG